jgi:hypothetical protein
VRVVDVEVTDVKDVVVVERAEEAVLLVVVGLKRHWPAGVTPPRQTPPLVTVR